MPHMSQLKEISYVDLSIFEQLFQGYLYWLVAFYSSKFRPGHLAGQYLVTSETQCVLVAGAEGITAEETWAVILFLH